RVFGKESIAGMNGLGSRLPRRRENLFRLQITLARRIATERDSFVGVPQVSGVFVRIAEDGDGADAEFPANVRDPASNLPPVRNQNLLEHEILKSVAYPSPPFEVRAPPHRQIEFSAARTPQGYGFVPSVISTR